METTHSRSNPIWGMVFL